MFLIQLNRLERVLTWCWNGKTSDLWSVIFPCNDQCLHSICAFKINKMSSATYARRFYRWNATKTKIVKLEIDSIKRIRCFQKTRTNIFFHFVWKRSNRTWVPHLKQPICEKSWLRTRAHSETIFGLVVGYLGWVSLTWTRSVSRYPTSQ